MLTSARRPQEQALNLPEPLTYVYRAGGADPRAQVNQALDDVGFAAADIRAAAEGDLTAVRRQDMAGGAADIGSPLSRAPVATIPHTADWARQLTAQLDGWRSASGTSFPDLRPVQASGQHA